MNRRAVELEDDTLVVTLTEEGGHIASIRHKATGVDPMWAPTWPSIEPSEFNGEKYPGFGGSNEARLVAGMLGHMICLDLFGAPTPEEAAAGMPVHGEAATARYDVEASDGGVVLDTSLPLAEMRFTRKVRLASQGVVSICEAVENLSCTDRPIAWTQHVTLGKPFLEPGLTQFLLSAKSSRVIGAQFNEGLGLCVPDADFDWPHAPRRDSGEDDLSILTSEPHSGGMTAHQMDRARQHAYFVAWSPSSRILIGYVWRREDFPWLARWEENHLRSWAPWNGEGFALGLEFGVSPFVENRREIVQRATMFDTPTFRWLGARATYSAHYCAFVRAADALPSAVEWDGATNVTLRFEDSEEHSL
ncbi:MAG: hypothetical protein PW789_07265 [Edaphobacter sp.]|uniref:hypothetical protein n=1 Tax=Edaphobacter sp. TaxID=1934404 RepID=UPI002397F9F7|nr:hypothetical protein [Edaphobacter sp.]MDE1176394.1 hypothetical protein [Edaphobacter sp.]